MPRAIRLFEVALWTAFLLDLINNLLSWSTFAARFEGAGPFLAPTLTLAGCVASPAIGMILWFCIVRRHSRTAKWIITALVAIGIVALASTLFSPVSDGARSILAVATIAGLIKAFAVTRLFTADAASWFAPKHA